MKAHVPSIVLVVLLVAAVAPAGCTPSGPCTFTTNAPATAYRLPDAGSDVFGQLFLGESYEVLAQTADGWVGFDPGIAQAGNIGLAHHRWVQLNATISPSCLDSVDVVTLEEVEADLAASGG